MLTRLFETRTRYDPSDFRCAACRRRRAAVLRRPVVPFALQRRLALLHRLAHEQDHLADRGRDRRIARGADRPRDAVEALTRQTRGTSGFDAERVPGSGALLAPRYVKTSENF